AYVRPDLAQAGAQQPHGHLSERASVEIIEIEDVRPHMAILAETAPSLPSAGAMEPAGQLCWGRPKKDKFMSTPLEIVRTPVLSDNYVWLMREPQSGSVGVVDPAGAGPVLADGATRRAELHHHL